MAETTSAPAATPAPAAQPTEQPQSGERPRAADGKFAPSAKAAAPAEAPRRYKLPGTDEELDEPELLARASEKSLEGRALQARLKRLEELEALEAKRQKDPLDGLSVEERRRLAVLEAKRWQEEQEEANLPPEVKEFKRRERLLREREEKLKAEVDRRTQEAEQAQMEQLRTEAVETVRTAVELSGLPKTAATYKRLLGVMANAARSGVAFPPEVLARKLRAVEASESQENFKALGGKEVLRRYPALVEVLNGLDDDEALALLEPLGERLRKRALAGRGLAPATPAPDNVRRLPAASKANEQPEDPWEVQRRIDARVRGR